MLKYVLIGGRGGGGWGALDSQKIYDLHFLIDVFKPTCNLLPLGEMTILMSIFLCRYTTDGAGRETLSDGSLSEHGVFAGWSFLSIYIKSVTDSDYC